MFFVFILQQKGVSYTTDELVELCAHMSPKTKNRLQILLGQRLEKDSENSNED